MKDLCSPHQIDIRILPTILKYNDFISIQISLIVDNSRIWRLINIPAYLFELGEGIAASAKMEGLRGSRIFREWNHSRLSLLARRTTRSTLDQPAADLSRFQYLDTACRSRHARDLLASTPNFCASLARPGIVVGLLISVYSKTNKVTSFDAYKCQRRRDKWF